MALYRDNPGELSETLTQYATLIVLRFLTSTPNFPPSLSRYIRSSDFVTIAKFTKIVQ